MMGFDITGLGAVFDFGSKVIDKIFPDKDAADRAKVEMMKLQQQGAFKELELQFENAKQQLEVNKAEAASQSTFVAGWRPFIGWVCGFALAYNYILMPSIVWIMVSLYPAGDIPAMPTLNMTELMTLLFGMLGLGALRSFDKTQAGK
jgi:hypothetical protein